MLPRSMVNNKIRRDFSKLGKIGAKVRWGRIHSKVKINSKITKNKIAIFAYLSGDGNIAVRNRSFHYDVRFFIDNLNLARRICTLFKSEYNVVPKIRYIEPKVRGYGGFYKVEVSNKPVCLNLDSFGKYGKLDWSVPNNLGNSLLREWIKCFFDCEAYVNKHRRQIQVKSVNGKGLNQIGDKLRYLGINCRVYGPYDNGLNHNPYFMLSIHNSKYVKRYCNLIGFYHPMKMRDLQRFFK